MVPFADGFAARVDHGYVARSVGESRHRGQKENQQGRGAPSLIIQVSKPSTETDDPYADFKVPDDPMW